jgi:hypothetical protein
MEKDSKVDYPTVEKDVALGETHDIGANLFLEAEQLSAEELETEGAKVLRILDWRIMPIVRYTPTLYRYLRLSSNMGSCSSSMLPM